MSEFLARLGKLAAVRNVAVVLVSEATTRVRREEGTAVVRPGISTRAWEEGVGARVAVLRDWEGGRGGEGREGGGRAVRFAGVMKLGGVVYEGVGEVVAFTVENVGVFLGGGGRWGLADGFCLDLGGLAGGFGAGRRWWGWRVGAWGGAGAGAQAETRGSG